MAFDVIKIPTKRLLCLTVRFLETLFGVDGRCWSEDGETWVVGFSSRIDVRRSTFASRRCRRSFSWSLGSTRAIFKPEVVDAGPGHVKPEVPDDPLVRKGPVAGG